MAFRTVAQIKAAVAAVLGTEADSLPAFWTELIEAGTESGRNHILSVLGKRGYTFQQVATWDGLSSWHRTAAIYYTLSDANLDDDRALAQLDRFRERLKDLDTMGGFQIDEAPVDPANQTASVGFGFETTEGDRFRRDMTL